MSPAADSASGSAQTEDDASSADPELLAQLAEIAALNTAWSEQITSLEMHSVVTLESDLLNFQQTVKLWMQLEPLRMYMETELPNFFAGLAEDFADEGGEGEGGGDESSDAGAAAPPPLFVLKVLVNEDGVFMAPPESEGWVRVPDEGFDISQVMALGGGLGDEISDAISAAAPLLCAEISNGTVAEEELDGRPVWLVTCDVDSDAVDEVMAALSASGAGAAGLGMPLAGEGVPEIQADVVHGLDRSRDRRRPGLQLSHDRFRRHDARRRRAGRCDDQHGRDPDRLELADRISRCPSRCSKSRATSSSRATTYAPLLAASTASASVAASSTIVPLKKSGLGPA